MSENKIYNYDQCYLWKWVIKNLYPNFPKDMIKYIGRFLITYKFYNHESVVEYYFDNQRHFDVSEYGLFMEVFSNALDNGIRSRMNSIDPGIIKVKLEDNLVSVYNEGAPIPLGKYKGMWIPELILAYIDDSTNYDDRYKSKQNRTGVKRVGIYSKNMTIDIVNRNEGVRYTQSFGDYMGSIDLPHIRPISKIGKSSTTISYTCKSYASGTPDNYYLSLSIEEICRNVNFTSRIPIYLRYNDTDYLYNFKSVLDYAKFIYLEYLFIEKTIVYEDENTRFFMMHTPGKGKYLSFVNNNLTKNNGIHVDTWLNAFKVDNKNSINYTIILSVMVDNPHYTDQSLSCLTRPKPKVTITDEMRYLFATWSI